MAIIADSHAHLTYDGVYEEIDEVLSRAQEAGLNCIINICTGPETLERGKALCKRYPWIYNVAATTPHDVDKEADIFYPQVEAAARAGELLAIGETGLDYFYEHSPRERQKQELIRYFKLALELDLPVVIHCRDAFDDFFDIQEREYPSDKGVLHCFTGTVAEAKKVIERGWYLSLSGIVTFKKSTELQEVAKIIPLEQMLVETDTPYLAPMPYRGRRNEPAYVTHTARFIAELRGIPYEQLASQTAENCRRLFSLPPAGTA